MKTKAKKIIAAILFCLLTVGMLLTVSYTVQTKEYYATYNPFFEDASQIDVLMFGTSHVACGISPMYLWKHYGISSYNFGNSGEPLAVTYWEMQLAFQYCKPKVVLVDTFGGNLSYKYNGDGVNDSHLSFDAFPLSITKVKAVNDLIDDLRTRLEYLFNVSIYHNRWDQLSQEDFAFEPSRQKGTWAYGGEDRFFASVPQTQGEITSEGIEVNDDIIGICYARKIIELCKQEGIDLVFINTPHVSTLDQQMNANGLAKLAEEYDVPFINFLQADYVIDMSVDMMDFGHTNPSGMNKVTDYLGSYIVQNYGLEDHRTDKEYSNWSQDYETFLKLKDQTIRSQKCAKSILELLHDDDYSCFIRVGKDSVVPNDEYYLHLFQNISRDGVYYDTEYVSSSDMNPLSKLDDALDVNRGYFLVVDGKEKICWEDAENERISENMGFGRFKYYTDINGDPRLYLDGADCNDNLFSFQGEKEPDLQIIVLNNATNSIILNAKWDGQLSAELNFIE